jgi:hypothetical protein
MRSTEFISATLAMIALVVLPAAVKSDASTVDGCWKIVPSPNADPHPSDGLYRVSAISANDVWASGDYGDGPVSSRHPMSEHWNGTQWTLVPVPSVGTNGTLGQGIVAISPNDVWMVGYYDVATSPKTLTEHWDGNQWNVVPSPNMVGDGTPVLRGTISFLRGVAAVASNDVWAVGYYDFETVIQPLIEHWDGNQWTIVSGPNVPGNTLLHDVKGLSGTDIWAIGWSSVIGTVAIHWDGAQWNLVQTPNIGQGAANSPAGNELTGISPINSNDVWAVGNSPGGQALTMHWDGTQWTLVPNPVSAGTLYGVKVLAPDDVWAIGATAANTSLAIHWDGVAWSIVPTPDPSGQSFSFLFGIDATSATDIWAVCGASKTLAEHFTSPCLAPTSVVSRKTHGSAGDFDVDLANESECRSGGANGDYTLVFTFADALTSVEGTSVTSGTGSVNSGNIDGTDAHNYVVSLTGVANAQTITISLTNVSDTAGDSSNVVSASMKVLVGDVSGNGIISNTDVASVKAQVGASVDSSNFRSDVNVNGLLSNTDVSAAKAEVGTSLP